MESNSAQMCHDVMALLGRTKLALMAVADEYDMTMAQVGALYAILRGDATMGQVAHTLHCDASNATGIIDRLVAQGLVVRQENEQDRRVKSLQLTAKGRAIVNDIIIKLPEALGCNSLTAAERNTIHTAVGKMTAI